ncbi:MAG: hypothetical protein QW291_01225 [Thermofilaceae archaeon]
MHSRPPDTENSTVTSLSRALQVHTINGLRYTFNSIVVYTIAGKLDNFPFTRLRGFAVIASKVGC